MTVCPEAYLEFPGENATSVDVTRVWFKALAVAEDLRRRSCRHRSRQQTVTNAIPTHTHQFTISPHIWVPCTTALLEINIKICLTI